MDDFIRIRGAREHNLRSIDLDLPRNKLLVITGLSGSGRYASSHHSDVAPGSAVIDRSGPRPKKTSLSTVRD
jgi:excinuclease ABC subunit A